MFSLTGRLFAVLIVFAALGCAGGPKRTVPEEPETIVPLTVVIEDIIAGTQLNQVLKQPAGLAVDPEGGLYVADRGNNRIIQFNSKLNPVRDMGGFGSEPGQFREPGFLALDNSLTLVVSDPDNRRLTKHDGNLNYFDEISLVDPDEPFKYRYATGVAITKYGEIWMADKDANRVAIFDNSGQFDRFIGDFGYEGGNLSSPEKIVHMPPDLFVVFDAGNSRIVTYDDYGGMKRKIEDSELDYPNAGAIDSDNRLWVIDGASGRLFCFTLTGRRLFVIGPQLPGDSKPMRQPYDMAILPDGRLVISDSGNNRLLICRIVQEES